MNQTDKNNDTGLRILEILKILLEGDVTKQELIEKLRKNSKVENVYTQEAFIKYFNTIEALGLKINKENKKYKLENSFYKMDFTQAEQELFIKLAKSGTKIINPEIKESLCNVFRRIEKYTDINFSSAIKELEKEDKELTNDNFKNNVTDFFLNLIKDEQLTELKYTKSNQKEETVIVEIKNITRKNDKFYITCYNSTWKRNKKINVNSITRIEQKSAKTPKFSNLNPIIFELYGRLANIYKLKPSEKVINFSNTSLTISNTEEDKDALLLRLLKYGENCKILKPDNVREEFISLTDSILNNLEQD